MPNACVQFDPKTDYMYGSGTCRVAEGVATSCRAFFIFFYNIIFPYFPTGPGKLKPFTLVSVGTIRMVRLGRVLDTGTSTTLADLLTPLLVANPFSAMRAPLLWWLGDKFEDGLTHGGQCRLRWRPVDSFFPVLLF